MREMSHRRGYGERERGVEDLPCLRDDNVVEWSSLAAEAREADSDDHVGYLWWMCNWVLKLEMLGFAMWLLDFFGDPAGAGGVVPLGGAEWNV